MIYHLSGRVSWEPFIDLCRKNKTNAITLPSGKCKRIHIINKSIQDKVDRREYLKDRICLDSTCVSIGTHLFCRESKSQILVLSKGKFNLHPRTSEALKHFIKEFNEQIKEFAKVANKKYYDVYTKNLLSTKLPTKLAHKKELDEIIDLDFVEKYFHFHSLNHDFNEYRTINKWIKILGTDLNNKKNYYYTFEEQPDLHDLIQLFQCIVIERRYEIIFKLKSHNVCLTKLLYIRSQYDAFGLDEMCYDNLDMYIRMNLLYITNDYDENFLHRIDSLINYNYNLSCSLQHLKLDQSFKNKNEREKLYNCIKTQFDILVTLECIYGEKCDWKSKYEFFIKDYARIEINEP